MQDSNYYNSRLIFGYPQKTRKWYTAIEWCHFWWSWATFKVIASPFKSNFSHSCAQITRFQLTESVARSFCLMRQMSLLLPPRSKEVMRRVRCCFNHSIFLLLKLYAQKGLDGFVNEIFEGSTLWVGQDQLNFHVVSQHRSTATLTIFVQKSELKLRKIPKRYQIRCGKQRGSRVGI